jgi:Heterokaryon incompatibility protein (HET)
MRLLHTKTLKIQTFPGVFKPKYAILSHTWGDEEVTYQDIQNVQLASGKKGFKKIRLTCKQAVLDGLDYAWIDTCCIVQVK